MIGFEQGLPVSLDGEELSLAQLIGRLNGLAGAYGIGRIDMIENRAVGIKSREVYEAPAAIALITAHSALEDVILTKDEARIKRPLEQRWTELVYEGLWYHPAREALDAFVAKTQELVTGEVRLELRPNAAVVTGRRSDTMLYAEQLASYGTGETFPHQAAAGFIEISAARDRVGSSAGTRQDAGVSLWAARVEGSLDPAVWEFLRGDDAELLFYDCEATAEHARRLHDAGILTADELEEAELTPRPDRHRRSDRRRRRGRPHGDRAPARRRRPQDPRGSLAQRPGRRGLSSLRARRLCRGA